jgi:hypothetical protein
VVIDTIGARPEPSLVDFAQTVHDTLTIEMPAGWSPDFWPEALPITEVAGTFVERRQFENGQLRVLRDLRANTPGRAPEERRSAALLRDAYRASGEAEWVFRRGDARPDTGSP